MKDLKISKELLSKVLGIHTILMNPIIEPGNNIGYLVYGSQNTLKEVRRNHKQINIYEFAFRCKEWAYSTYGIMIQSYPYCGKSRADALKGLEVDEVFKENTEVEAIIQACEWILEYKKNQCTK